MTLIQQIKNLENTFEYTPKDDCFGRGWDKAKEEIIKMIEGQNMKYKYTREEIAYWLKFPKQFVSGPLTQTEACDLAQDLLAIKPKTKSKCLHNKTKLVFERGGGYLGEFCESCKKYISRSKTTQPKQKTSWSSSLDQTFVFDKSNDWIVCKKCGQKFMGGCLNCDMKESPELYDFSTDKTKKQGNDGEELREKVEELVDRVNLLSKLVNEK